MKKTALLFVLSSLLLLGACTASVKQDIEAGAGTGSTTALATEVPKEESAVLTPPKFDEGKPYLAYKLNVDNNGQNISGKVYIPREADGALPAVICSHGYNNPMTSMQGFATDLAKNGFIAVIFDFCGGSANATSDGDPVNMSVITEKSDLLAVFEAIAALKQVDETQMYLLGASQGGLVSAMAAAELGSERVKALAMLYPAFVAADDARAAYASLSDVPDTVEMMGMTVGKAYYEALWNYDPYESATDYTGSVLILHGTADTTVPYEYGVRAAEAYPNAGMITYEGQGHGFSGQAANDSVEKITTFFLNERNK